MAVTEGRTYGGLTAEDRATARRMRFLEAGLDVMGARDQASVRKVLVRSKLAPKFFYEEFAGLEELEAAVFDSVVAEAETKALAALARAPRGSRARIRAVLSAMTDLLLDDPRKGRILLVPPPHLLTRRSDEITRFAGLIAEHSKAVWRGHEAEFHGVSVSTMFAMGGFTETLTAVLDGRLEIDREVLVDDLTELFLGTGSAFRRMVG